MWSNVPGCNPTLDHIHSVGIVTSLAAPGVMGWLGLPPRCKTILPSLMKEVTRRLMDMGTEDSILRLIS